MEKVIMQEKLLNPPLCITCAAAFSVIEIAAFLIAIPTTPMLDAASAPLAAPDIADNPTAVQSTLPSSM